MGRLVRGVLFVVLTFVGLMLLGASFWRASFATLALLLLRLTPMPPLFVFGLGATIFALGLLQWSTGLLLPH